MLSSTAHTLQRLTTSSKPSLRFVIAVFLFVWLGFVAGHSQADETDSRILIEESATIDLTHSLYIFPGENPDWQSVSKQLLTAGELNPGSFFSVDEFGMPLWMRVDLITGQLDSGNKWLLGLDNGFGGDMSLYVIANGELHQETVLSSKNDFSKRPHPNHLVHFPLDLPSNTNIQLLLRIDSAPIPFFVPKLTTESLLADTNILLGTLLGFAYGLLVTMTVYHLVLAIAVWDKSYLIYSFYVFSNCLWMAIHRGLGFKFVWPNAPWVESHLSIIMYYTPVFMAILFTVQFLQLSTISKNLTRFYYGMSFLLAGLIVIRIANPQTNVALMTLTTVVIFFSFIYTGIYALNKGVVYARFYLIAWTIHCLSIANWMLIASRLPAVLPQYGYWLTIIAFDIQVMLLAIALAHRIRTMRQSKLEAEADNRAKSEFLARMSHEIRTPLSGVLGMAELLADRLKDKTNIYYTNIIRSSGTSLLTVINDILDYSKFSSGKMALENIPFSLQRLAVDSLDIFKVKAAEKNIELIVDFDLDMLPLVMGDPTRVKQVMLNLISNAVKFTNEGQIVLRVRPVDHQPGMVRIAVIDSGEGISQKNQKKLFEAFSQASDSTAREHGGTGLGLSICKQLAYIMGGEIGVESKIGQGSTFWITTMLPRSHETRPIADLNDITLQGIKLLVVEDNYTFAELLQTQAHAWGMTCSLAKDGQEALTILQQKFEQGIHFDLISLDLVMPIMDGLETGRHIQSDQRFSDIPRLLLTSATNFPPQRALTAAGINRVMEKPTLPADLQQAFKELLANENAQTPVSVMPGLAENSGLPRLSILVAEDNSVNQMVINGILKRLNQSIVTVENGQLALQAVQQGEIPFDLILMDCDMPIMDGKSATIKIREWEQKNIREPIWIIALTAHAVQSQIDECFAAGMNEYLAKPIDIGKLEELLRKFSQSRDKTVSLQTAIDLN